MISGLKAIAKQARKAYKNSQGRPKEVTCSGCNHTLAVPDSLWEWKCWNGHTNTPQYRLCNTCGADKPMQPTPKLRCPGCGTLTTVPKSHMKKRWQDAGAAAKKTYKDMKTYPKEFHCQNCSAKLKVPEGNWTCQTCRSSNHEEQKECERCYQKKTAQKVVCGVCHRATKIPKMVVWDSIAKARRYTGNRGKKAWFDLSGRSYIRCPRCKSAIEVPRGQGLENRVKTGKDKFRDDRDRIGREDRDRIGEEDRDRFGREEKGFVPDGHREAKGSMPTDGESHTDRQRRDEDRHLEEGANVQVQGKLGLRSLGGNPEVTKTTCPDCHLVLSYVAPPAPGHSGREAMPTASAVHGSSGSSGSASSSAASSSSAAAASSGSSASGREFTDPEGRPIPSDIPVAVPIDESQDLQDGEEIPLGQPYERQDGQFSGQHQGQEWDRRPSVSEQPGARGETISTDKADDRKMGPDYVKEQSHQPHSTAPLRGLDSHHSQQQKPQEPSLYEPVYPHMNSSDAQRKDLQQSHMQNQPTNYSDQPQREKGGSKGLYVTARDWFSNGQ